MKFKNTYYYLSNKVITTLETVLSCIDETYMLLSHTMRSGLTN